MSNDDVNWMVPLRRAVVKKALTYRDFLADWLEQLRDTDNSFVLGTWYNDPEVKEFTPDDYNKGIVALRRWLKMTFEDGYKVATSPVGVTTLQTYVPNFHARLWKGPKRVLLEQRAKDDPAKLAEIQPFNLKGGRIELQLDDQGKPKEIQLLPGDVLEIALHEFLVACGQKRFEDVEFDPMGSFYLGTTVKSRSGRKRVELPPLHDNMLAMRFQLVIALNMANCYHDEPVYSADFMATVPKSQAKPEGAGIFARGMPYGGNPVASLESDPLRWQVNTLHTNLPQDDRPIHLPTFDSLQHYADGLPLTWGWTCSPFAIFFFNVMADAHQTNTGLLLSSRFRSDTLTKGVCLSASAGTNTGQVDAVIKFQGDHDNDPLLLHNLTLADVQIPREQTPLADLCEIVMPEGAPIPGGRTFTDPKGDRIKRIPLPAKKDVAAHDLDVLWPGAGITAFSSSEGHEFAFVKMYKAEKVLADAKAELAKGSPAGVEMPHAGRLAAFNPLSGEDYCVGPKILPDGHHFIFESGAAMVPSNRDDYFSLKLAEVDIHKLKPTAENQVRFKLSGSGATEELQIDDDGNGSFRSKKVSCFFYIREGEPGSTDPRTLANIYAARREAWIPVSLTFPWPGAPASAKKLLANFEALYAERAVPFPTILEVAPGSPSRARTLEQLVNHRKRIEALGDGEVSKTMVKAELVGAKGTTLSKLQSDLELIDKAQLRKDLLALLPPEGSK